MKILKQKFYVHLWSAFCNFTSSLSCLAQQGGDERDFADDDVLVDFDDDIPAGFALDAMDVQQGDAQWSTVGTNFKSPLRTSFNTLLV